MTSFRTIQALSPDQLNGKRALVRVDFNVPIKDGQVTSDQRMRAALPTIQALLAQGAKVVLMSHLGRPEGEKNPKYSLQPVATHLQTLLAEPVLFVDDCIGAAVEAAVNQASERIVLLENTRFYQQETKNDPEFAKQLAALGDVFVNDAFGAAHRAHASTAGVAAYLPAYAGLLMDKEISSLGQLLNGAQSPFVAIIGGAKVSSKLAVLENLMQKVDALIIGGAMAYTFLAAQGKAVGTSLIEPELFATALQLLAQAERQGVKVLLPLDHVTISSRPLENQMVTTLPVDAAPSDFAERSGMDIGPLTVNAIQALLQEAKTVLWNGPMGMFESAPFAAGTQAVAKLLAERTAAGCMSVVGGGDSVAAVEQMGLGEHFTHVSTGGGASLEFLEGRELPGVAVLH